MASRAVMLAKLNFPTATVRTPLAQITIVDANEGDCCLVDFCQTLTKNAGGHVEYGDAWKRMLIDTGPSSNNIARTLTHVAACQYLPLEGDVVAGSVWVQPKLDYIQITHPDNDHNGNATTLLDAMAKKNVLLTGGPTKYFDQLTNCIVQSTSIPEMYPDFDDVKVEPQRVKFVRDGGNDFNSVTYALNIDKAKSWIKKLAEAGLTATFELHPSNSSWTLAKPGAEWQSRKGSDPMDEVTIRYNKAATEATTELSPTVKVKAILHYQAEAVLKVKVKEKAANVTRDVKSLAYSLDAIPVPLGDSISKRFSTREKQAALKWVPETPPKRIKVAHNLLFTTATTLSVASIPVSLELSQPSLARIPITIMSIADAISIGKKVEALNKGSKDVLDLTLEMPAKGDRITHDIDEVLYGRIECLGPTSRNRKRMLSQILLARYALADTNVPLNQGKINLDTQVTNQSSIVTLFERYARYEHVEDTPFIPPTKFSMLFTGDAYDQKCDIRDTILGWRDEIEPIKIDVLKVPHHGSNVTTGRGFWKYIRASVYIICGSHHNTSGNPKLSTLSAIVKSFQGRTPSGPPGTPFRLFFSSAKADLNYKKDKIQHASAILGLFANPDLRPWHATKNKDGAKYEVYRLTAPREASGAFMTGSVEWASCGSICFAMNDSDELITLWDRNQWVQCLPQGWAA